jgi:hypothetical protein
LVNYNEEIISAKSLAGFELSKNINDYLLDIYQNNISVEIKIYNQDKKNEIHHYNIDNNIKINTLKIGKILNISCMNTYNGKYHEKLHSGITIQEVKEKTETQNIMNGGLFVDRDFGFCFMLPHPYDEIADSINNIPDNLILNEICVGEFDWWFNPELTPDYAKL